jgi:Basic region leucine zipper
MSAYRGRHGPNLHNYISNLNRIDYDDGQFAPPTDPSIIESDLAMFTNTDFSNMDYPIPALSDNGEYNFDIDATYTSPANMNSTYNTPIQPAPPVNGFQMKQFPHLSAQSSPDASGNSLKRRAEPNTSPAMSAEEASRHAAEEDKRRRNTAASARFRVKKKQREQTLEKTVKEAQDKNTKLEARVTQLEMENKWLKGLITEKKDAPTPEAFDLAYKKFQRESEERETHVNYKRGVGTN